MSQHKMRQKVSKQHFTQREVNKRKFVPWSRSGDLNAGCNVLYTPELQNQRKKNKEEVMFFLFGGELTSVWFIS